METSQALGPGFPTPVVHFKLLEILPNSIAQERVFGIAKRCGLESWHPIGMHRFSCDKDHN